MDQERQAIKLLQQGNIEGLEALSRLYYIEGTRTAFLITHDKELAEDIVQNAFIRIYERIYQFDPDRPFRPWFLRIVANDAVKSAERKPANLSLQQFQPFPADAHSGSDSSNRKADEILSDSRQEPLKMLEQAETRREILSALDQLTPGQRAAIVLRYYLDLSEDQMAEQLGIAPGTVKWRLHTARQRLRKLIRL